MSHAPRLMPKFTRSTCFTVVVFAVALGISGLGAAGFFKLTQRFTGKVRELLPEQGLVAGWTVSYEPLAETPELRKQVEAILSYDEAVMAVYRKDDFRISVYLAYWRPSKTSVRSVARHTPDICWPSVGWTCVSSASRPVFTAGSINARHPQIRVFKANQQTEYVLFWHVAGSDIVSVDAHGRPSWSAAISEFRRWGNEYKQEQFFLRISSNKPFEFMADCAIVQEVLARVPFISYVQK